MNIKKFFNSIFNSQKKFSAIKSLEKFISDKSEVNTHNTETHPQYFIEHIDKLIQSKKYLEFQDFINNGYIPSPQQKAKIYKEFIQFLHYGATQSYEDSWENGLSSNEKQIDWLCKFPFTKSNFPMTLDLFSNNFFKPASDVFSITTGNFRLMSENFSMINDRFMLILNEAKTQKNLPEQKFYDTFPLLNLNLLSMSHYIEIPADHSVLFSAEFITYTKLNNHSKDISLSSVFHNNFPALFSQTNLDFSNDDLKSSFNMNSHFKKEKNYSLEEFGIRPVPFMQMFEPFYEKLNLSSLKNQLHLSSKKDNRPLLSSLVTESDNYTYLFDIKDSFKSYFTNLYNDPIFNKGFNANHQLMLEQFQNNQKDNATVENFEKFLPEFNLPPHITPYVLQNLVLLKQLNTFKKPDITSYVNHSFQIMKNNLISFSEINKFGDLIQNEHEKVVLTQLEQNIAENLDLIQTSNQSSLNLLLKQNTFASKNIK